MLHGVKTTGLSLELSVRNKQSCNGMEGRYLQAMKIVYHPDF